jgi:predicted DNA-binding transcriptional regulator YafY
MPPANPARRSAEARLLKLAAWLHARREPVTREEIYAAFPDDYAGKADAREKKWTRDKQDLKRLGMPVGYLEEEGDRGAYLLDPSACALPRLEFTPEEATVLWTAGQAALRTHDHPLHDDLEIALRKLIVGAKGLPPRAAPLETETTELEREKTRAWLEKLTDAVERRKRVRIVYQRTDGSTATRHVDVYGYAWRRGQWIFVGYCHLRNAVRLFLLGRVQELVLDPVDKKRADYEVPKAFDIHAWSRQEPWDYLVHEPREVVVRFRGSLARIASQILPSSKVSTEADGSRVARFTVRNLRGLVRQALAWGPEAELVEPEDGRAMAREMLGALSARLRTGRNP